MRRESIMLLALSAIISVRHGLTRTPVTNTFSPLLHGVSAARSTLLPGVARTFIAAKSVKLAS